jgi:hypothetical protein
VSWRRSPLVGGCATVLAVASLLLAVAVWNRRAIRSWLDPSYRDPTDLTAVERTLRSRFGTANLSVFWTTRTPPGTTVRLAPERRRRVGVHVVDAPRMPDLAAAETVAAEIAREVRASAGPATRVRRSFWFEGGP